MTKYILVGGYPHKAPDWGRSFCEELVKGFGEPVNILECLFSRPKESWNKAFSQDEEFFSKNLPMRKLNMELATPTRFIEQLRLTNAIYFRGGNPLLLINTLKGIPGWQKELGGKTVAGSSAGADIIAKYYYHLDELQLRDGLGILPLKVLVHYESDYNAPRIDWNKVCTELKNYKENLPLLTLAEGQFEIRTIEGVGISGKDF